MEECKDYAENVEGREHRVPQVQTQTLVEMPYPTNYQKASKSFARTVQQLDAILESEQAAQAKEEELLT